MATEFKKQFSLFFVFAATMLLLTFACKKGEQSDTPKSNNCVFVQNDALMQGLIDNDERQIMDECLANRLTSKSEIEANLIGEWELVGHGEGWVPTVSQPCGYVTISADELIFDFDSGHYDSVTLHTWELVEQQNQFFALEASPVIGARFYMNIFCDEYMYSDATPVDGNMYLYQKVE